MGLLDTYSILFIPTTHFALLITLSYILILILYCLFVLLFMIYNIVYSNYYFVYFQYSDGGSCARLWSTYRYARDYSCSERHSYVCERSPGIYIINSEKTVYLSICMIKRSTFLKIASTRKKNMVQVSILSIVERLSTCICLSACMYILQD